ncbi:hypothetical protein D046_4355A, partial [Vibrio parahaemolyticus V-223/04]
MPVSLNCSDGEADCEAGEPPPT